MRTALVTAAGVAMAIALPGAALAGCNSNSTSSTATSGSVTSTAGSPASTSAQARPIDYTALLIRAEEINAPETFTATATIEFDGPVSALAPPDFVTDVGQKQDAAIKSKLAN